MHEETAVFRKPPTYFRIVTQIQPCLLSFKDKGQVNHKKRTKMCFCLLNELKVSVVGEQNTDRFPNRFLQSPQTSLNLLLKRF